MFRFNEREKPLSIQGPSSGKHTVTGCSAIVIADNMISLQTLLPKNKYDLDAVSSLQTVGYPTIEPLLGELVGWLADGNWPVAKPIGDLFVSIGLPVLPTVRKVLQGTDAIHQYFSLAFVVSKLSPTAISHLRGDLTRIADVPSADQIDEGVSELAREILAKIDGIGPIGME